MTSLVHVDSFLYFIFSPLSHFNGILRDSVKRGENGTKKRTGPAILDQSGESDWSFRSVPYPHWKVRIHHSAEKYLQSVFRWSSFTLSLSSLERKTEQGGTMEEGVLETEKLPDKQAISCSRIHFPGRLCVLCYRQALVHI